MTYQQQLREVSLSERGYVTTAVAKEIGVPTVELRKLAARGTLEHVARGVYRFTDTYLDGDDGYYEAVLRAGRGAVLVDHSVLAMHDLALVVPKVVTVATPHRVRLKDPKWVRVMPMKLNPDEITSYRNIPSMTVAKAIENAFGNLMPDRLLEAINQADHSYLITKKEAIRLRRALRNRYSNIKNSTTTAKSSNDLRA